MSGSRSGRGRVGAAGRFAGERAVVIGYGASGRASSAALAAEGAVVWVSESRPAAQLASIAPEGEGSGGIEVRAGGHRPEHLDTATLVVVSPGVRPDAPVVDWARKRGLPVWGELELGARLCTVPFVAVTGTNGKTTTAELVAAMMRAAGLSARACGNIGYPFPAAAREPFDALVVEASSFQLAVQDSLHPRVSVLLNLAPDHLDWHEDFEAYAAAKSRIYAAQRDGDIHIGNADDPDAAGVSRKAPCEVRWVRGDAPSEGETGVVGGAVVALVDGVEREVGRPSFEGRGLLFDAAAASAAGLAFGLPPDAIGRALAEFVPLPHRGEVVAEVGKVKFIDDSKATNPHATLEALERLSGAVLIAGGLAKGVDLSPLAAAARSLAAVVAIGEAAPAVANVFEGLVPVHMAFSMEEAVEIAYGQSRPGGAVVLAPACASQDMFRDYAHRGDRFAEIAWALARAIEPEADTNARPRDAEPFVIEADSGDVHDQASGPGRSRAN